jgi:hypothetical protein
VYGVDAGKLQDVVARMRSAQINIPIDEQAADVLVLTSAVDVLVFTDAFAAMAKILNHIGWSRPICCCSGSVFACSPPAGA